MAVLFLLTKQILHQERPYWTKRIVYYIDMSKRKALLDKTDHVPDRNVQKKGFIGQHGSCTRPKCPIEELYQTKRIMYYLKMSNREALSDKTGYPPARNVQKRGSIRQNDLIPTQKCPKKETNGISLHSIFFIKKCARFLYSSIHMLVRGDLSWQNFAGDCPEKDHYLFDMSFY
jgi:hypothetical protein